jgi:ribonuclease P protein subunit POP4
MKRTRQNLLAHELIGLRAKVAGSSDPTLLGLEGVVVDETKNTLLIEVQGRRKRLLKQVCLFGFHLDDGEEVLIDGRLLCRRPEDRVKLLR